MSIVTIHSPTRTNRKKNWQFISHSYEKSKWKIKVCVNAFVSITGITHRWLNLLASKFKYNAISPKKTRRGCRESIDDCKQKLSMIEYIKMLKCRKSHHTHRDTNRSYLLPPPGLSTPYMWDHWVKLRNKENKTTE